MRVIEDVMSTCVNGLPSAIIICFYNINIYVIFITIIEFSCFIFFKKRNIHNNYF